MSGRFVRLDPIPTATPLSAAEDEDGRITEGSVTPGGHRIGPKAWRLIVSTSNHDDYIGAILDVIDEAAARQPVVDGVLDAGCRYECPFTEEGHAAMEVDHEYVR